jgi:hypothetical protein
MLLKLLPLNSVPSLGNRKKSQGPKAEDKEDLVQLEFCAFARYSSASKVM